MEECAHTITSNGEHVTLKTGAFPHVKIREWTIDCYLKNGKVLLRCPERDYTLEVTREDIEGKS